MKHHTGSIEVVTGSMFCGKTDELIRRLRRATIARQKVKVFKQVLIFCTAHHSFQQLLVFLNLKFHKKLKLLKNCQQ